MSKYRGNELRFRAMRLVLNLFLLLNVLSNDLVVLAGEAQSFNYGDGFAIRLPDGWSEIPRSLLDEYQQAVHASVPSAAGKKISYGFHLRTNTSQIGQPRILVVIERNGCVPDTTIRDVVKDLNARHLQQKALDGALMGNSVGLEARAGNVMYDEAKKLLWIRNAMRSDNVENITGINATYFTENGTVAILASARTEEFDALATILEEAIRSVSVQRTASGNRTPDPELNTEKLRKLVQWGTMLFAAILFGVYQAMKPHLQKRAIEKEMKTNPLPRDTLMRYRCEHCGETIQGGLDMDGKIATCPHCGMGSKLDL